MKLRKIKASNINKLIKATVHKSGKLGFTKDAADFLELSTDKVASLSVNEDYNNDKNLYVTIENKKSGDKDGFNVSKAGEYFYINLKGFYEQTQEDFRKINIVYNISKDKIEGEEFIVFKRKLKKNEEDEEKEVK